VKYKPSVDLPAFAREARSLSPSVLAQMVLDRRNEKITPDAVGVWFKRNPDVYEALKLEIVDKLPTAQEAVDDKTFTDGFFEELRTVKEWIMFMKTRRHKSKPLKPEYIDAQVRLLRYACKTFHKHPDRLTYRDAQEIFMSLEADKSGEHWENGVKVAGRDSCSYRRALKDFLKSKGSQGWQLIGVGKPSGYGQFNDLKLDDEIVRPMLEWIKEQNFKIGVIDTLMYHKGIRITAVLTAQIAKFQRSEQWDYLTVLEKFRETPTHNLLKEDGDLIQQIIGDRKDGLIFEGITDNDCAELNREAFKQFCPSLEPNIVEPNHAFRHFCAQHLRKLTHGNSALCSKIMKCSKQSFDESYGAITDAEAEEGENDYLNAVKATIKK
jgi:integrase